MKLLIFSLLLALSLQGVVLQPVPKSALGSTVRTTTLYSIQQPASSVLSAGSATTISAINGQTIYPLPVTVIGGQAQAQAPPPSEVSGELNEVTGPANKVNGDQNFVKGEKNKIDGSENLVKGT